MLTTCIYPQTPSLTQIQPLKELAFTQPPLHANSVKCFMVAEGLGWARRMLEMKSETTACVEQKSSPIKTFDTHIKKEKSLAAREHL